VFELVKNCYDANAKEVTVNLYNVTSHSPDRNITIKDDGHGMSLDDVKNKWMVVGTRSKRVKLHSAAPFNRRFVGEKGIGRFAVDKLGERLIIRTKTAGTYNRLVVNINWDEYEKASKDKATTLFTDIRNTYSHELADKNSHGTTLEILQVREVWTKSDIDRLYKELTKIVSPFSNLQPPFKLYLCSNEHDEYKKKFVRTDAIEYSSAHGEINFDLIKKQQEVLKFNDVTGEIFKSKEPYRSFGPVSMKIYYFDEKAKKRYRGAHKNDDSTIDGIKIYRDGIITTPFAEFESHRDKKRDVLGIDKRLWSHSFDKVGTRELIGVLNITKSKNPRIIDSTNRQDFIDNQEYRDLKEFVIEQIDAFSKLKVFKRTKSNLEKATALRKADKALLGFSRTIERIEKRNPELTRVLAPLKKKSIEVQSALKKGIIAQEETQQEFIRKENIYLSLMSLQDYAIHISHAVRTSLGKIIRMAEYFKKHFPDPNLNDLFKQYSVQIYKEMETLSKVIDFMLSYAGSNLGFEEFSLKSLIEELLLVTYRRLFEDEGVDVTVEIKDDFTINTNKTFILDIIQNLVSNSIKALEFTPDKRIKCSGHLESGSFVLSFSDNGCGIKKGDEKKIFDLYHTTTAEQGGAGLGLFIVKTRIDALKGTIEVAKREFRRGATFRITLPFEETDDE
jgi:signal transduction histidine kinase